MPVAEVTSNETSFDWVTAHSKVKSEVKSEPPSVEIDTVSLRGFVQLRFSKQMLTAPLEIMQKLSVRSPEKSEAIVVEIVPGLHSDPEMLGFDFEITKYDNDLMEIQLLFESPVHISSDVNNPELLKISFPGWSYFFDTEGQYIAKDTILVHKLPPQITNNTVT
jgi:hypothetical protein